MFSYRRGYTTYYNRNLQASDSSDSGGDEDALAGTTAATDKENEKLSAMLDGPDDLVVRVELVNNAMQSSPVLLLSPGCCDNWCHCHFACAGKC